MVGAVAGGGISLNRETERRYFIKGMFVVTVACIANWSFTNSAHPVFVILYIFILYIFIFIFHRHFVSDGVYAVHFHRLGPVPYLSVAPLMVSMS